jgi:hypothetical protein
VGAGSNGEGATNQRGKEGGEKMNHHVHVEKFKDGKLTKIIGELREQLAAEGMAFGAIYIGRSGQPNLLLLAKDMPRHMWVEVLEDLQRDTKALLDHYTAAKQ